MKRLIILMVTLIFTMTSIHSINISNINYQAFFSIDRTSNLALIKYNTDYIYLSIGDTLAEELEVIELNGDYILFKHLTDNTEHKVDIARPAETSSGTSTASQPRQEPTRTTRPTRPQPASTPADRNPEIYLEPQNFNITWANARATLIIMARGFEDLYSISMNISYDSSLAVVDTINEGHFMRSRGGSTDFHSRIDNGSIDIEISRLEETGASGNGMLASIIFRPLESGTTDFDINSITVYDSSYAPLDVDTTNSIVNIQLPEIDEEQEKLDQELRESDRLRRDIPRPTEEEMKRIPYERERR